MQQIKIMLDWFKCPETLKLANKTNLGYSRILRVCKTICIDNFFTSFSRNSQDFYTNEGAQICTMYMSNIFPRAINIFLCKMHSLPPEEDRPSMPRGLIIIHLKNRALQPIMSPDK